MLTNYKKINEKYFTNIAFEKMIFNSPTKIDPLKFDLNDTDIINSLTNYYGTKCIFDICTNLQNEPTFVGTEGVKL